MYVCAICFSVDFVHTVRYVNRWLACCRIILSDVISTTKGWICVRWIVVETRVRLIVTHRFLQSSRQRPRLQTAKRTDQPLQTAMIKTRMMKKKTISTRIFSWMKMILNKSSPRWKRECMFSRTWNLSTLGSETVCDSLLFQYACMWHPTVNICKSIFRLSSPVTLG